jgi:hypothetical protein
MSKHFNVWSFLVIASTLVLFGAAVYTTGFTHDLLLEAGVFLVSVKLIVMAYRNSAGDYAIQQKLDEIHSTLQRLGNANALNQELEPIASDRPAAVVSDHPGGGAKATRRVAFSGGAL